MVITDMIVISMAIMDIITISMIIISMTITNTITINMIIIDIIVTGRRAASKNMSEGQYRS
jgi:hypothetical protein